MQNKPAPLLAAAAIAVPALVAWPSAAHAASATLQNASGEEVGTVTLTETPNGVLVHAKLENLPPGVHAFHFHAVGTCEPPFKSAGGHFNPTNAKHGFLSPNGPHEGDMPNIHVPESGALEFEVFAYDTELAGAAGQALLDDDGAAVMIHEGADDYRTDPAGDAGDRIACGVIEE